MNHSFTHHTLDFETPADPALQASLETIDAALRTKFGIEPKQTATGILDLNTLRLAMINPDHETYGASVPKIAILLAYFQSNPTAVTNLDPQTRHELGLMIKDSSNELAAKYSKKVGLKKIQDVLYYYSLYDANRGGGIWVGKHYGETGERIGSPAGDNSHAATVRQLLRFYLMLEQERLVSPAASQIMREIFASPKIAHHDDKFVKGLAGRDLEIIRKSGWWEDWLHDTAIITGGGRHYILVGLTKHPRGDDYLVELAPAIDDALIGK